MTRNVLITGATGSIGFAIAKKFKEQGYKVCAIGRNLQKIEKIKNNFDYHYCSDLTQEGACDELFNVVKNEFGNIDILINNAGSYIWAPIEKTIDEEISSLIKLNFEVPYRLTKLVIPDMQKNSWGRIINIGSISGAVGEANATLYSGTKSALIGFTKALALEKADKGITANIINPGWVNSELTENALNDDSFTIEETLEMIPQRRFIEPIEIAECALYLASDKAKGITGQYINLCAGLSIG